MPECDEPYTPGGDEPGMDDNWRAAWAFVATHPPLRCFEIEVEDEWFERTATLSLLDALIGLQSHRPTLQIRCTSSAGNTTFKTALLEQADIPQPVLPNFLQ